MITIIVGKNSSQPHINKHTMEYPLGLCAKIKSLQTHINKEMNYLYTLHTYIHTHTHTHTHTHIYIHISLSLKRKACDRKSRIT
jgi:hypothetical protein